MFGSAVSTRDLYSVDLTPCDVDLGDGFDGPREAPAPAVAHGLHVFAEALHDALVAGLTW